MQLKTIANKERFTIRAFMKYVMKTEHRGIRGKAWKGSEGQIKKHQ